MHSFVITADGSAASSVSTKDSTPPPQPLSSADLYKKASEATVRIEKMSADGTPLGKGIGFWIGDGRLLTAFDVIDGASSLRIPLKDGSQVSTDQVMAWDRWQDWALLKFEANGKALLKRGPNDSPSVGDRCFFLELGPAGAKLADGSVTGKNSFQKAGERLLVASGVTSASFGGPLLDEYGNYVGIMGGSIVPGGDPLKTLELLNDPGPTDRATDWGLTGLAVPQALLPDFSTLSATTTLAELASRGEFLSPVVKTDSIQYATLSSVIEKGVANTLMPKNYKRVFSRRDNKAVMFVNWQVVSKEKLNCALRLLNADNKLISESKPREVSLAPGKYVTTTWDIPVGALPPGLYRVDVMLDSKTAWRDFFRVTD